MQSTRNDSAETLRFAGSARKLRADGTEVLSDYVAPGESLINDSGPADTTGPTSRLSNTLMRNNTRQLITFESAIIKLSDDGRMILSDTLAPGERCLGDAAGFVDSPEALASPEHNRTPPLDPATQSELIAARREGARVRKERQRERSRPDDGAPRQRRDMDPLIQQRIAEEYASGRSCRSIADGLDQDRIPTTRGARNWSPVTIQVVVERTRG